MSETDENYPGLKSESRPLFFVLGDQDQLCALPLLYKFLANSIGNTRIGVVGGDHGFEDNTRSGSLKNSVLEANLRMVSEFITLAIFDASFP